jgi:hypothetical protein
VSGQREGDADEMVFIDFTPPVFSLPAASFGDSLELPSMPYLSREGNEEVLTNPQSNPQSTNLLSMSESLRVRDSRKHRTHHHHDPVFWDG